MTPETFSSLIKETVQEQSLSPEGTYEQNLAEIISFIDRLPHLDDLDKYWARDKDAPHLLKEGTSLASLKEKYEFYDHLAELQLQILTHIPQEKHEEIRNIIRRVTSKPSHGRERNIKMEHVLRIKRTVDAFRKNQISLQFLVEQRITSGDVHFGVAQILDEEAFEQVRKTFPDRFWRLSDQMSPVHFPNFTSTFNFALKNTFLHSQAVSELKKWPEKLKESAVSDGEEITTEFFPESERQTQLSKIKALPAKNPDKILSLLLSLRTQREKQEAIAQKQLLRIKSLFADKNPKASLAEIEDLRKKFGKNIDKVLDSKQLFGRIENNVAQAKRIEKEIKKEKNPTKKQKLVNSLRGLQEEIFDSIDTEEISVALKQQKRDELLEEINQYRRHGDLRSAEQSARNLQRFDFQRSLQEIKEIQKEKHEQEGHGNESFTEIEGGESEKKRVKLRFLERCIEHAESVVQFCSQLGIPSNDPQFWGVEGVRNRVSWLRKNGLWDKYKRFNDSDRNMPHKKEAGGFRFRWLDLRTGSNLTLSNAESGIRYLNRYKQSGYAVATLAGAFSVDWKGSSSPVYSPERFIEFVNEEMKKVRGGV